MKLNGQSRSFVKQVQMDLLALCDADLFHTVHQWIDKSDSSEVAFGVPEDTRFALGYSRVFDAKPLSHHHSDMPGIEREGQAQWHAPAPQHLRTLLPPWMRMCLLSMSSPSPSSRFIQLILNGMTG